MSIIKMLHAKDPFARIPNETARDASLRADALGVLTYLASRPEDWTTRDREIMNHFGRGRDWMRSIWTNLENAGYARREHRVRQASGRLVTITTVSVFPVFITGGGSTGGGLPATGEADGGVPTTIKRKTDKERKKKKNTTKPVASGDGKPMGGQPAAARLSFKREFGVRWPESFSRLIDESRACAILRSQGIDDPGIVRRILGEWAAMSLRGFHDDDPVSALIWACKNKNNLAHTKAGDDSLPRFS